MNYVQTTFFVKYEILKSFFFTDDFTKAEQLIKQTVVKWWLILISYEIYYIAFGRWYQFPVSNILFEILGQK